MAKRGWTRTGGRGLAGCLIVGLVLGLGLVAGGQAAGGSAHRDPDDAAGQLDLRRGSIEQRRSRSAKP